MNKRLSFFRSSGYFFQVFILWMIFSLFPPMAYSKTVNIIAIGSYNMGNGESSAVAKQWASFKARKNAIEQCVLYIEDYLKFDNLHLNEDKIRMIASCILKTGENPLDNKMTIMEDEVHFSIKIRAMFSIDEIDNMAEKTEEGVVDDYRRILEYYEKVEKEIKRFKKEYSQAKEEKNKGIIKTKISEQERLFQANMYFDKGYIHSMNYEYAESIDAFTKGVGLFPDHFKFYLDQGTVRNSKDRYDSIIPDYSLAVDISPKYAEVYNNRGFSRFKKGQYDRAIFDYTQAIEINSRNNEFYRNRGISYYYKGLYDQAISDYNKALYIKPGDAYAYKDRGNAYRYKGQYDQAIFDCYRAIQLDPELTDAYKERGHAFIDKGLYTQAIRDYNKAITIDPMDAGTYNYRGTVYSARGQYILAISDYDKAVEIDPSNAEAYFNKALASESLGLEEDAMNAYRLYIQYASPKEARDIEYAKEKLKELGKK